MADIQEQTQLANEISEQISTNAVPNLDIDEVCGPQLAFYENMSDLVLFTGRAQGGIGGARARGAQRAARWSRACTYTPSSGCGKGGEQ